MNFVVLYADLRLLLKKDLTVVLVVYILIYFQNFWLIFYSWCMNLFLLKSEHAVYVNLGYSHASSYVIHIYLFLMIEGKAILL